jgi:hypothetical protein
VNVSSFFYAKICSLLVRRRSSQPVQRVYWPENVIDWLGKWRQTCVMRHARGQKLQRGFRRKWPFCMDLYSVVKSWEILCCAHIYVYLLEVKAKRYIKVRLFCLDCELNCGCLQYCLLQKKTFSSPCVYTLSGRQTFLNISQENFVML